MFPSHDKPDRKNISTAKGEFKPSGFKDGEFKAGTEGNEEIWRVAEILTKKKLLQEGAEQKHCAGSYDNSIVIGRSSIWSMTFERYGVTERRLTIEVLNKVNTVVQIRGKFNRRAEGKEVTYVRAWATFNNLSISPYAL